MRARACAKESELRGMANKKLQTRFGNIKKLGWNPRNISDVAFTNLCESIFRDPDFMVARPIIIDENNDKYVTGSASFWNSFCDIWSDMAGEDEEWMLECYRLPSKNYKGKDFLTCSIA